jgi:hypothetical protein
VGFIANLRAIKSHTIVEQVRFKLLLMGLGLWRGPMHHAQHTLAGNCSSSCVNGPGCKQFWSVLVRTNAVLVAVGAFVLHMVSKRHSPAGHGASAADYSIS